MAFIELRASPGHFQQDEGSPFKGHVFEIGAKPLARGAGECKRLEDVRLLVKTFGEEAAAANLGASFFVSIVVKGRKPAGFDAARNQKGGIGEDAWMKTVIRRRA